MHADRLRLLAAHLRKPARERLHYRFDFGEMNCGSRKTRKGIKNCGSVGCAIGETPLVFPQLIRFNPEDTERFDVSEQTGLVYSEAAEELFGIDDLDAEDLFTPDSPRWWADYSCLGENAKAAEVADSIDAYVDAVEQGRSRP